MKYKMYKLTFPKGLHLGDGSLSTVKQTLPCDTFFSALCIEAINIGGEKLLSKFVSAAKKGSILISDALPYISNCLFVPKPNCRIETDNEDSGDKKEFKKMSFLPIEKLNDYYCGKINPREINKLFLKNGMSQLFQKVAIKEEEDNELYTVRVYRFYKSCGLYIIMGFDGDEEEALIDNIMDSLKYSGVGGKRNSGYGRFFYEKTEISEEFKKRLTISSKSYISLSASMAADNELESVLNGASYKLVRRSGFVQSQTYSENLLKKRDFYMFSAGSVFKKKFCGDIFDVSIDGNHPVYKYAKPIMIGGGTI